MKPQLRRRQRFLGVKLRSRHHASSTLLRLISTYSLEGRAHLGPRKHAYFTLKVPAAVIT